MAVAQHNKAKVRPVMDYRELNVHVDAFTADADVCASKLREWRQLGSNVSLLDLRKAYLQVWVRETMWPFQTVVFASRRYCLTRLGFGLNVAPQIMKTIVNTVVTARNNKRGDIGVPWWHIRERRRLVITLKVPTGWVWSDLQGPRTFGGWRPCLGPERSTGAGDLEVGARNCSSWSTRCLCETSCFLPVWKTCGAPTSVWMDSCGNRHHKKEGKRSHQRLGQWNNGRSVGLHGEGDHRKGKAGWPHIRRLVHAGKRTEHVGGCELSGDWCAVGEEWSCDWGRLLVATDEWRCSHQPGRAWCGDERRQPGRKLCIHTDSLCVYHWISDTLTGKARVRTKAASEMLIRRRLETIRKLVMEYNLSVDAVLVTSNCNLADRLTLVPQRWYDAMKKEAGPVPLPCAASVEAADKIWEIHHNSGHPGVRWTYYFVQLTNLSVSKSAVRVVVKEYQTCQSIDPAPARWRKGWLGTDTTWSRLGMDVTHYGSQHFLTLIDCELTRFVIWCPLVRQDSSSVICELVSIFYERGPPKEILTDNDTAFCSMEFRRFVDEWGIRLRDWCAMCHGIAERCHRSVKRIAAKKVCTIVEAVYRYNTTPKVAVTAAHPPMQSISTECASRALTRVCLIGREQEGRMS